MISDWDSFQYSGITNTGLTTFPGLCYIQSTQEDFILYVTFNSMQMYFVEMYEFMNIQLL